MGVLNLFRKEPEAEIGQDGLSNYARELYANWARRDELMARIDAAIGEHGLDREMMNQLPTNYVIAALILGIKG